MNELKTFENPELGSIRTIIIDSEPWFVGRDVALRLGYTNSRKALADHVNAEDKTDGVTIRDSIGRGQTPVLINEPGLYALIFGSKLETAKRFKHWVTHEVLPALRKSGIYETNQKELFADAVCGAKTSVLVGDFAKLLRQNGVKVGQNRLFAWLRNNGYLMQRRGESYNLPTQKSMEQGLMTIKEYVRMNPEGEIKIFKTAKITGKGQLFFTTLFLKEGNAK